MRLYQFTPVSIMQMLLYHKRLHCAQKKITVIKTKQKKTYRQKVHVPHLFYPLVSD